ncbi:hypothetical protein DQR70_05855 [Salmonella enterica subsp. enterica serovar Oslo]|nr:hypothetical protein [Salmonella enterica subsp. enterica serovar Oslo]
MLSLFRTDKRNVPLISPPRHGYLSERVDEGLIRAAYNYRRTTHVVESDHILIKILQQIGLSYEKNDKLYYNEVDARTSRIARAVGFTDYNAKVGPASKNSFFDPKIKEYVVSVTNGYTPLVSVEGLWQDFTPVKVLYHPYNDMSLNIRDGSRSKKIEGYAVITVDIPLLALQFHKWKQWARQNLEVMPGVEQFVFQYPLVNMMRSDADVSYFNHISAQLMGHSITPQRKNYVFSVPDVEPLVSPDVQYLLEHNSLKPRNLIDLAQSILLLNGNTVWDFLQMPNIPVGSGNAGVLTIGTLPWLETLAQMSFQSGSKDNGFALKYLQKRFRDLKSGGYLNIEGIKADDIANRFNQSVVPYLS